MLTEDFPFQTTQVNDGPCLGLSGMDLNGEVCLSQPPAVMMPQRWFIEYI